jgi:hypothetical protein
MAGQFALRAALAPNTRHPDSDFVTSVQQLPAISEQKGELLKNAAVATVFSLPQRGIKAVNFL